MSIRYLDDTLKASLISEDPFLYAHLVKFERIIKTVSSKPGETATDYSYITDAATNISFDDESSDVHGNLNGSQTYIANRLLKVGSVNETTEAKASSLTINIASTALDTKVEGQVLDFIGGNNADTVQINLDSTSTGYEDDFVERGFTEGDKVTITHKNGTNTALHSRQCIITSFASNNKTMHCATILGSDGVQRIAETSVLTTSDYTLTLSTDEVVGALNDPEDTTYAAYINREVFIYKTHIDPDTNDTIGDPYLIFKGIIAKVKVSEDPSKSSTVKWTLTSHWGDFDRVNGRITSDEEHRALGVNRRPDTASLHRNEYAYDFGFKHSEQAINIIAIYQIMETRYKLKKSGWLFKRYKQIEYQVEVDRDVDLRFNLHAKHLPVLYGVNKTDSIPIFADTLKNDPSKIYIVYAICEGEVSGIYDMYIDDQSRICIDKNDSDTRSTQTDTGTIDVVCEGRMDRGDTLSSAPAFTSASTDYLGIYSYSWNGVGADTFGVTDWRSLGINLAPEFAQNSATGVTHEKQNTFEFPIKAKAIFHAGRSHQRSDDMLTRIGTQTDENEQRVGGFKLQQDKDDKDKTSYWDSNFRLLDTAYLAVEYEIADGDVTIPEIDFVVRGREVQQYNYDYSYREMLPPSYGSEASDANRANFKIGDYVDVYEFAANSPALAPNIQIVDLYKYVDAREEEHWKFRFASNPLVKSDGTTSSATNFYMVPTGTSSSSDDRFHFATWNNKAVSGTVGATLKQLIDTNAGNTATGTVTANSGGTGIDITNLSLEFATTIAYLSDVGGVAIGFSNGQVNFTAEDLIARIASFQIDSSKFSDGDFTNVGNGADDIGELVSMFVTNAVTLTGDDVEDTVDDYYNGQIIKITRKNIDGTIKVQTRRIIGYDASEKKVYVGDFSPVETTNTPITGTTYRVKTAVHNGNVIEFETGTDMSGLDEGDVLQRSASVIFPLGTKIESIVGTVLTLSDNGYASILALCTFYEGADTNATVPIPASWHFIPFDATDSPSGIADSFEIIAEGDKKVSINPAIQLLDYLTNERFGRGLNIDKDTNLETFKQAARLCDARSDVTLTLENGTYTVGQKWQLVTEHEDIDYFQWQGTIKTVENITYGSTAYKQVTFEDCIGKLAHKWFDWKSYEIGQVVYNKTSEDGNKAYIRNAAGTVAEASLGTAITSLPLELSTNSSTTAAVHLASPTNAALNEIESTWDRNPIIKKYNTTEDTFSTSGYSLYDSDDVKYWRYMGWQSQDQREVTRHQTNATIRTETPLFQNVNSFLGHFNGILRYSNGKYELDVESTAPTINTVTLGGTPYTDPRIITADDIIGAINIDDAGLKGSANSVSVSIPDPQVRFDNRNITFYKSEYLKEDRGIPKKKSVKNPFITNYFNARINAEQYLDQSRFSRKINFQMGPKGLLLLAGTLIKVTYPRFNWDEKLFRISNLQIKEDCLVQVTAEEHDDNSYLVEGKDKDIFGIGSATGSNIPGPLPTGTPVAESLTATTNLQGKIKLSWANNVNFDKADNWSTEIWYNNNSSFNGGDTASRLISGLTDPEYDHNLQDITANTSYYYWIRHVKDVATKGRGNKKVEVPSLFEPLNNTSGVEGTAWILASGTGVIYLYKSSAAEPTDDPSDDIYFPTLTVPLSGTDAGKITGVAATGQGAAAITNTQVTITPHASDIVTSGNFVVDSTYTIVTPGTTEFTLIGAANNNVGTVFTAEGAGAGTGTATMASGASATATLTNGVVTAVAITTGGTGYINVPTISITGGGGESAAVTATVQSGAVHSLTITAGGTNYSNNQIIDTQGNATGWYTIPRTPDFEQSIWLVAATANGAGSSDDISRSEWTEPAKFSGMDGMFTGSVTLYQTSNIAPGGVPTAPALPDNDLVWNFEDSDWMAPDNDDGDWSQEESPTTINNKYLWKTTAAVLANRNSDVSVNGGDTTTTVQGATLPPLVPNNGDWSDAKNIRTFAEEGESAKAVKLQASRYVVAYSEEGAAQGDDIVLTWDSQNTTSPTYRVTVGTTQIYPSSGTSGSLTTVDLPSNLEPALEGHITVTVQVYEAGEVKGTDSITIYAVQDGKDAITIVVPNDNHTIPAASDGSVSTSNPDNYLGSGTDIRVFKGSTAILYDAAANNNKFRVSSQVTAGTIAAGGISAATFGGVTNNTARVAKHSGMSTDTATITYTITVRNNEGEDVVIIKEQSLSKAKEGEVGTSSKAVKLTASRYVVAYSEEGVAQGDDIVLNWSSQNVTSPTYRVTVGSTQIYPSSGTSGSLTTVDLPSSLEPSIGTNILVTVQVYEAGSVKGTDSITIHAVQDGKDALTLVVPNSTHTLNAAADGAVSTFNPDSYIGSGTDIRVFRGSTPVLYAGPGNTTWGKFSVAASGSGITVGSISKVTFGGVTDNTARVAKHSGMADSTDMAAITYTVVVRDGQGTAVTLTATQSITKAKEGGEGEAAPVVKLTGSKYAVAYTKDGALVPNQSLVFTATPQNIEGTITYEFLVGGEIERAYDGTSTYTMASTDYPASGSSKLVQVNVKEDGVLLANVFDTVSVYGVKDGSDAITIGMSNATHSVSSTNAGVVNSGGTVPESTNDIRVYRGSTLLGAVTATNSTAANTFKATAVGTNITVSSANGTAMDLLSPNNTNETLRYTDHSAMSSSYDTATVTYTIKVYDSASNESTHTMKQTITKAKTGEVPDDVPKIVTGYIYWIGTGVPGTSDMPISSTTWTFGDGTFLDSTFNPNIGTTSVPWSLSPPEANETRDSVYYLPWSATQTIIDGSAQDTGPVTFVGSPVLGFNFSGLVTFSNLEASNPNTTTIHGDNITTGSIAAPGFNSTGGSKLSLTLPTANTGAVFETKDDGGNTVFKITHEGNITANNFALVSGSISDSVTIGGTTATNVATNSSNKTGGAVGAWTIDSDSIYCNTKESNGEQVGAGGGITIRSNHATYGAGIHTPIFYAQSGVSPTYASEAFGIRAGLGSRQAANAKGLFISKREPNVAGSPYDVTIGDPGSKSLQWNGTDNILILEGDMEIFSNIGGTATSPKIVINGNTITVYDSSNNARVKIGNLA